MLAIGHYDFESAKYLVDHVEPWPVPFNPSEVVAEICQTLKAYRITSVTGDKYAGQWVSESFGKHGITYFRSELNKSKLYLEFEPLVNTQQLQIPQNKALVNELLNLERKTGRSGRDSVDHPPKGSDDLANSVAGVCHLLRNIDNSAFQGCDLS